MRPRRVRALVAIGWLLVVALAAVLRLGDLGLIEFKYDEASVAGLADVLVHQGRVPATSIVTSAGVQNSPLAIYMLAPAALASWRPEAITGYVGLLNVVAVALTGLMVARYWGTPAGLASGLLYAAGPLAVQYSRKIWAPELMPLLSVLCLWCLVVAFAERRFWFIVPAAAAWSALVQLHQASIWLAPLFVVLAVAGWRAVKPAPLVPAVVAGLLVAAPYLGYEAQHHWDDLRQLLSLAGKPATVSALPWWYAWSLLSGWGLPSFLGSPDHVLDPRTTSRTWLDVLELGCVACGAAYLVSTVGQGWAARGRPSSLPSPSGMLGAQPVRSGLTLLDGHVEGGRSESSVPGTDLRVAALAVLVWAIFPPLGLTRAAVPVFPHYLIYWFPAPFVLAGVGIHRLAVVATRLAGSVRPTPEKGPPALSRGVARSTAELAPVGPLASRVRSPDTVSTLLTLVLVAIVVTGDGLRTARFRGALAAQDGGGEYGAPLRDSETMVARTLAAPSQSRRYVADRGDLPAVYRYLDRTGGAAYVEPDLALVVPPEGLSGSYVYPAGSYRGLDALLRLPGVRTLPASGGYQLLTALGDSTGSLPPSVHAVRYGTAAGLDLIGWEGLPAARPGAAYSLTVWWRVAQAGQAPAGELKVFTHLLDPQRRTVAQHDALGYPPRYWTPGERFATFFTLQIPASTSAGSYRVIAGLYTLPSFEGVRATGQNGEALGTEIPLTVLTVA